MIGILSLTKNYTRKSYFTEITYLKYIYNELRKIDDVVILTNKNLLSYYPTQFNAFFLTSYQINFYGGKPNPDSTKKWNFITEHNQKIFQLFCDFQLPLTDYAKILKAVFGIKTNKLNPKNFYLIHYCKDLSFIDRITKNKWSFPVLKKNCFYYDISDLHHKYRDILKPINFYSKDICYVGNFRGGARTKILTKFAEFLPLNKKLFIFGTRWKTKDLDLPENIELEDPIIEDEATKTINQFFGQVVTYDNIGIKYKADNTRLIDTLVSGCLPIIDARLSYLNIPRFAKKLLWSTKKDIDIILKISTKERNEIILKYQKYFKQKYSKINFARLIKKILK